MQAFAGGERSSSSQVVVGEPPDHPGNVPPRREAKRSLPGEREAQHHEAREWPSSSSSRTRGNALDENARAFIATHRVAHPEPLWVRHLNLSAAARVIARSACFDASDMFGSP